MKERIGEYLEGRSASSEEIASDVLKLRGAAGVVADKVVAAAVEGDRRFAQDSEGRWCLRGVASGTRLREATFCSLGVRLTPTSSLAQVAGVAGCRFQMKGSRETLPEIVSPEAGVAQRHTLEAFAAFRKDAVPVAFRLSRWRDAMNRTGRRVCGTSLLHDGICLFRLGRRIFPDRSLPSVDALAEATGLPFLAERGLEDEADLQAELLLYLLERCEALGLNTVEDVVADLYPEAVPVHFEAFAFDEAFLEDLPQAPGVYVMRDREGRVIYVGKSVNLRDRVRTYFSRKADRPEKTQRILERIWAMEVETVGSELEALLLEARLIRLCVPEFNTQVGVHARPSDVRPEKQFVMVLPSADPESIELFCVRKDRSLCQLRVRRDLMDWEEISGQVSLANLTPEGTEETISEGDEADMEILKSWMIRNREAVNWVDMERSGSPEEVLRILRAYVEGCDVEGWEKVWRV